MLVSGGAEYKLIYGNKYLPLERYNRIIAVNYSKLNIKKALLLREGPNELSDERFNLVG